MLSDYSCLKTSVKYSSPEAMLENKFGRYSFLIQSRNVTDSVLDRISMHTQRRSVELKSRIKLVN